MKWWDPRCRRADFWAAQLDTGHADAETDLLLRAHLLRCSSCAERISGISTLVTELREMMSHRRPPRVSMWRRLERTRTDATPTASDTALRKQQTRPGYGLGRGTTSPGTIWRLRTGLEVDHQQARGLATRVGIAKTTWPGRASAAGPHVMDLATRTGTDHGAVGTDERSHCRGRATSLRTPQQARDPGEQRRVPGRTTSSGHAIGYGPGHVGWDRMEHGTHGVDREQPRGDPVSRAMQPVLADETSWGGQSGNRSEDVDVAARAAQASTMGQPAMSCVCGKILLFALPMLGATIGVLVMLIVAPPSEDAAVCLGEGINSDGAANLTSSYAVGIQQHANAEQGEVRSKETQADAPYDTPPFVETSQTDSPLLQEHGNKEHGNTSLGEEGALINGPSVGVDTDTGATLAEDDQRLADLATSALDTHDHDPNSAAGASALLQAAGLYLGPLQEPLIARTLAGRYLRSYDTYQGRLTAYGILLRALERIKDGRELEKVARDCLDELGVASQRGGDKTVDKCLEQLTSRSRSQSRSQSTSTQSTSTAASHHMPLALEQRLLR